jgi:hypothetical protein
MAALEGVFLSWWSIRHRQGLFRGQPGVALAKKAFRAKRSKGMLPLLEAWMRADKYGKRR